MKKYIIEVTETAEQDLESIISYLRYNLGGDIIADKYKTLFKQCFEELENFAGSIPVLNEKLIGHNNIRKVNVKKYVVFYIVDEKTNIVSIVRIGQIFMDWEKYLKEE